MSSHARPVWANRPSKIFRPCHHHQILRRHLHLSRPLGLSRALLPTSPRIPQTYPNLKLRLPPLMTLRSHRHSNPCRFQMELRRNAHAILADRSTSIITVRLPDASHIKRSRKASAPSESQSPQEASPRSITQCSCSGDLSPTQAWLWDKESAFKSILARASNVRSDESSRLRDPRNRWNPTGIQNVFDNFCL